MVISSIQIPPGCTALGLTSLLFLAQIEMLMFEFELNINIVSEFCSIDRRD
jgi:hypothetical protein